MQLVHEGKTDTDTPCTTSKHLHQKKTCTDKPDSSYLMLTEEAGGAGESSGREKGVVAVRREKEKRTGTELTHQRQTTAQRKNSHIYENSTYLVFRGPACNINGKQKKALATCLLFRLPRRACERDGESVFSVYIWILD